MLNSNRDYKCTERGKVTITAILQTFLGAPEDEEGQRLVASDPETQAEIPYMLIGGKHHDHNTDLDLL